MSKSFSTSFGLSFAPPSTSLGISPAHQILPADYQLCSGPPIGHGGSAVVFKGMFRGDFIAVKQFKMDNPNVPQNKSLLAREAKSLLSLDHSNVIKCFGVCYETASLLLEYAAKDITVSGEPLTVHSLRQLLDTVGNHLSVDMKLCALYQIITAVKYLHEKRAIHGDLKSGNVLVTGPGSDFIFKVCDFGQAHQNITSRVTATMSSHHNPKRTGTVSFESPEVIAGHQKTKASDIYSFAMIMFELLNPNLSYPWAEIYSTGSSDTISALILGAVNKGDRPPVRKCVTSSYVATMKICWEQNPAKRPTAAYIETLFLEDKIALVFEPETPIRSSSIDVAHQSPLKSAKRNASQERHGNTARKLFHDDQESESQPSESIRSTSSDKDLLIEVTMQASFDGEESSGAQSRESHRTAGSHISTGPFNSTPVRPNENGVLACNAAVFCSNSVLLNSTPDRYNENGAPACNAAVSLSNTAPLNISPVRPTENGAPTCNVTVSLNNSLPLNSTPVRTRSSQNDEMTWLGYATRLNVKTLKSFQIEALNAYRNSEDVLLIQSTGSGKSLCFQIPSMMLHGTQYGIVIVPTISLGLNHQDSYDRMGVKSIFLKGSSTKEDYDSVLRPAAEATPPNVIILLPETLFGTSMGGGILSQLDAIRLQFVAVDEVHLVLEWASFRESFNEIQRLKNLFSCPVFALTATLKPGDQQTVKSLLLRDPIVIQGSVDRPNVSLHIATYKLNINKDKPEEKWDHTAHQIIQLVKDELSIVYCSYAEECNSVCATLCSLGVAAACYTGQISIKDKQEIYRRVKEKEVQILVATKAFGMGIDLPDVRHIVHIGLPESISLLAQEFGRAGRDGNSAFAHLLVCEYLDLKKLNYWLKNLNDREKLVKTQDFVAVFKFFSCVFTGSCLRQFVLHYFDDGSSTTLQQAPSSANSCCTSCDIKSKESLESIPLIRILAQVLELLGCKGLLKVYEKQLVTWISGEKGSDAVWMAAYFNKADLDKEATFGCQSRSPNKAQLKLLIRGVLRQMLSLGYVSIDFQNLPGSEIMAKMWSLTDIGRRIAEGDEDAPLLPNPINIFNHLLGCEAKEPTPVKKRRSKKSNMVATSILLLEAGPDSWTEITDPKQFQMLGFYHDTEKLLYVEDYTKLKWNPTVNPHPDFLWEDINLSKGSAFPEKKIKIGDGDKNTFVLMRNPCAGIQMCAGVNKDGTSCGRSLPNKTRKNDCICHPSAPLESTGKCSGTLVYIKPLLDADNRRWLGLLKTDPSSGKPSHNHTEPIESKLPSALKDDIRKLVSENPDFTNSDISKGVGLGYNPMVISPAAANRTTLPNFTSRARIDLSGNSSKYIIEDFDKYVKNSIDAKDQERGWDQAMKEEIMNQTTPYLRYHSVREGAIHIVMLATPQMLRVLSDGLFIQADVTFPETSAFPYLLNIVCFNHETLQFQAVARVLMNNLSAPAYKMAFTKVFEIATQIHPEFEEGKHVNAWIVDFSTSQHSGLSAAIGAKASEMIRGCDVHFKRNAKKVANKVSHDPASQKVFEKIAYFIPKIEIQEEVDLAFSILAGEIPLDDEEAMELLVNKIECSQDELSVSTIGWSKAAEWVKFWTRPKILKMFTKAFTEMTDADWNICPKTTNACESQNKISHCKSTAFISTLRTLYLTDRRSSYYNICAERGITTGVSETKRKLVNQKRNQRNSRPRLVPEEEHDDDPATFIQPSQPKKRGRGRPPKKKPVLENADITACAKTLEPSPHLSDEEDIDGNIGRKVWIDTLGPRGRQYGWLQAIIESKTEDGGYVARYMQEKEHSILIKDLFNENHVRFISPSG